MSIRPATARSASPLLTDEPSPPARTAAAASTSPEETAALGEVVAEYESRLAELTAEGETRASARRRRTSARRHRLAALQAERSALDDLWSRDIISDETHRPLQRLLDHEEAMLDGQGGRALPSNPEPRS